MIKKKKWYGQKENNQIRNKQKQVRNAILDEYEIKTRVYI